MIQQIKANPSAFLKERGYEIPDGMTDPTQIANYLLRSGRVGNRRMQAAQQILQRMMGRR